MGLKKCLFALFIPLASGCARFAIELPRHITVETGNRTEIVGELVNGRTPVGGVDVVDGALPPGLALEFSREARRFSIRGVPSQAGWYEVDISAWTYGTNYAGDQATAELSIEVVDRAAPAPLPGR